MNNELLALTVEKSKEISEQTKEMVERLDTLAGERHAE